MTTTHQPIEVTKLTKVFGTRKPFTAVSELSFSLRAGEILGLLGPNGAGKSTTIQMLLGTLLPTSGDIRYFGLPLESDRSRILESVGYASGYGRLPWSLTVRENLEVQGRLHKLSKQERSNRIEELLAVFEIEDQADKVTKSLSAGQSTRLMLARAFIGRPQVALLDEPTASLDPDIAVQVREFVRKECREKGVSMLYTSHNMSEVSDLCQRVIFLKNGKMAAIDSPAELALKAALSTLRIKPREAARAGLLAALSAFGESREHSQWFELSLDHRRIPDVLADLHARGHAIEEIEIEKPTLEDFFLKLSAEDREYERA